MKTLDRFCVTILFVLVAGTAHGASWEVPGDFVNIQSAIDSALVLNGDTIRVSPGTHAGALINKSVEIKGQGGAIINDGPVHGSGLIQGFRLLAGSDGTTISHLAFDVDLDIMNAAGVDDVTITQCSSTDTIQGISNWRGSRWEISHNVFTDLRTRCGGGIAILTGDFSGVTVEDNVISHNKIMGTLHVDPNDCGGYSGTGIVLFADFRFGANTLGPIQRNRLVKNKISLTSDTPLVVDVVAIELTDTRNSLADVIIDNAIGFNDMRGTGNQLFLTPLGLDNPVNDISRNLGDNRGHGLHPNLFGPGGN